MRIDCLTLFPQMLQTVLEESITGRAVRAGILDIRYTDIRDFAQNKHNRVDDAPYGGGMGMVMQPGPIFRAYQSVLKTASVRPRVIYMSPQGRVFNQGIAKELAGESHLVLLCGHYEGVDERVIEEIVDEELSIGDYVLTGGEIPALAVIDAVARLVPGVLPAADAYCDESLYNGLLEYPQYTRPPVFLERAVPEVLLSGHHEKIRAWRRAESIRRTCQKRPELLECAALSAKEQKMAEQILKGESAMKLREETVGSEVLFEGRIITVRRDTVRLPNGNEATREIVEHPGGVAVVALDNDQNIYMVRQYRRPFDEVILEIPAGKLDDGEDPFTCCVRELKEETGLSALQFDYLGAFMLSPGFCREWIHIYLARDLSFGDAKLDSDEFLEVEKIPLSRLIDMIMENKLEDAKTVIGILKANELINKKSEA